MFQNIFLAFIPVFVAVDAIGTLPIFIALTQDVEKKLKSKIIIQSLWTGIGFASAFVMLGKAVFHYLGITMSDFMIAGGAILFCIAMTDLLQAEKIRRIPPQDDIGIVPIGIPLIVGPAVLTTSLMLVDQYGLPATLAAIASNIGLAAVVFMFSDHIIRILGEAGARALSKIMALLLAAIAVMMIRKGIFSWL